MVFYRAGKTVHTAVFCLVLLDLVAMEDVLGPVQRGVGLVLSGKRSEARSPVGYIPDGRSSAPYPTRESTFWDYIEGLRDTHDWEDISPLLKTAKRVSAGTMPMSLRCSEATLFRLHKPDHFHRGADFWKTFEDGPWKWSAKQRYSGKDVNPGHFFTLNGPSARVELSHYTSDLKDYGMLKVQGPLDNILDLTDWGNIIKVCRAMGLTGPATELILELVNVDLGGNTVTDSIGYYAYRRGYAGLVFFSARAMDSEERHRLNSMSHILAKAYLLDLMQNEINHMCVVLFSGSRTVRSIQRYSFAGEDWIDNPYFGATAEELDELTEYNEEYQRSACRVIWMDLPAPIVPWEPSEAIS